jgi:hypothetical protein
MSEYIIIFGPPASGKTLNKAALQEHYKCDHGDESYGMCECPVGKGNVAMAAFLESSEWQGKAVRGG